MPKMNKDKLKTTPNGELVSPKLHARLMAFKPVIEQANSERLTRSDLASRLILQGFAMSEVTAYNYVRMLGIAWHHQQPYRQRVSRDKLKKIVPGLLQKGLPIHKIAPKVGCSISTVNRFIREHQLVDDDKKICPKNYLPRQ
jgi:hypothetical protein